MAKAVGGSLLKGFESAAAAAFGEGGRNVAAASRMLRGAVGAPITVTGGVCRSTYKAVVEQPLLVAYRRLPEGLASWMYWLSRGVPARGLTWKETVDGICRGGLAWHKCGAKVTGREDLSNGHHEKCEDVTANVDDGMLAYLRKHAMLQARNAALLRRLHQRAIAYAHQTNMSDDCFQRVGPCSIVLAFSLSDREQYALDGLLTATEQRLLSQKTTPAVKIGPTWSLFDVVLGRVSLHTWWWSRGPGVNLDC
jgi:hypothetical protein